MNLVSFLFFALLFPFFLLTPIFLLVLLSPPPYIPCYQSVRLFTFFFRLIKSPKDTSVFLFICPRDFFSGGGGRLLGSMEFSPVLEISPPFLTAASALFSLLLC